MTGIFPMKRIHKFLLKRALEDKNKVLVAMTDSNKIQSLLQKLYPVSCDKELIRFGPKGDGGYLLPNDLEGIEACFSPGVAFVSGFEKDCADLGMKIFLADKSVEQPTEVHKLFSFTKKFVGVTSNDDFITMDNWVASSLPESQSDLLLQIDIEGYEYEVFLSISDKLMRRFRIIVVEFHYLKQLWNSPFFKLAARAFEKILQTHTCVHIHPNNRFGSIQKKGLDIPHLLEFTFLRNDRIANPSYQNVFPNPLDYDNTDNPPLILPKCWYIRE
jgi:hypothetical protein